MREAATAYHEAGHAVAAYFLHVPFRKAGATIIPDPKSGTAGCVYFRWVVRERPDVSRSDRMRLYAERRAMVSLAGMIAQRRFNRRSVHNYHGQVDFQTVVDLMGYFFESPVPDANLRFLTLRIQSELFENHPYAWPCVEAVAAALLKKKQLRGPELTGVIEAAICH